MNSDPFSLDRLKDIVVGPEVGFWPPAPIWYLVFSIVGIQFFLFCVRGIRGYRANAYRRQALRELASLKQGDALGLSVLLKRVALVTFPREQVAALSGAGWVGFLKQTASGVSFGRHGESPLASASTESRPQIIEGDAWQDLVRDARRWIKLHPKEGQG